MVLMCIALLSLRSPSPLSSTVSYSMYLLRVGNASDICPLQEITPCYTLSTLITESLTHIVSMTSYYHIIILPLRANWVEESPRHLHRTSSAMRRELSEVDDARIGGSTAQDHCWPEDQSCLSWGVKPEKLACQRHMKPFTPGIYDMSQHVITSSVLNQDPFCQIYKLYKILITL